MRSNSDDNSILLVEVLQPNKSDVLSYLNGSSGPPPRWARAVITQGASAEPHIANYMVCAELPSASLSCLISLGRPITAGRFVCYSST